MKGSVAAMIVWVAAGAFCLGQKPLPMPLKISPSAHQLEVTAELSGTYWSTGDGKVTVESSEPKLMVESSAHYTIKGDAKRKTLSASIGYTYPSGGAPASELTITGVKDAKGGTAAVFTGQVPPFAAQTGGGGGTGTPSTRTSTPSAQTANGANLPNPVPADNSEQGNNGTGAVGHPASLGLVPANWRDWLLYGDTAALGLLLVGGGILLWRRERPQPNTVMAAQPDVNFSSAIKEVKSDAKLALTHAAEAKREALAAQQEGEENGKLLKNMQKDVAALRDLRLETVLAERKESLRSLAQALDQLPREPSAAQRSGVASAQREEAATAAIVNHWLSRGAKDRGQLLELAGELEVAAELMNHQDLNRVFDDLTTFEYPFAVDADGPWLWVPIAGTQDFWAAPADAAFFGMGRAPSLLERLFEGMQKASHGFQFRTIYKPCRLRPVTGKDGLYTVVSKGLLRLEGASAPSSAAPPQDLDSLMPVKASTTELGTPTANPGKRLAAWVGSTSRQLSEQQKRIERVAAAQQKASPAPGDFVPRKEFNRQIDGLQRQLTGFDEKLAARAASPVAPTPGLAAPAQGKTAEEKTAPMSGSRPSEPPGLQPEPEVTASTSTVDRGVMTEGWQEALRRAAEAPGSEPETAGVPSDEVYVRRALTLAAELRELDPSSGAAVIHIKRDPMHEAFEVHETEVSGSNPGEVVCTTCGAAHTWQLAVCMGAREGEIAVLYPLGGMSKGRYLSGYSGLIADLPTASFTIAGIEEPARLRPAQGGVGTYMVVRKMRLVQAASGEAGR